MSQGNIFLMRGEVKVGRWEPAGENWQVGIGRWKIVSLVDLDSIYQHF